MTADADTSDAPRPGTTHPHLARERALKLLFAADVRQLDPRVLLDQVATRPADLELLDELEPDQEQVAGDEELQLELTRRQRLPLDDYTRTLVRGVAAHRPSIDALLEDVADRWPVHRMPAVDRNLLRMAVYELAEQDTPHPVVIDEGVALAIAFAGEKARSFVNGVLETVRKRVVAGEVDLEVAPDPAEQAPAGAEPPVADEQVEEAMTTERLDEVDEAASAAYDLALDLLDGEGPLEESPVEESPVGEHAEPPQDDDLGWSTDLDEPVAKGFSLDDFDHLDELAHPGGEEPEAAVEPDERAAPDEDAEHADEEAVDVDEAAEAVAGGHEVDVSELRGEDEALW